MMGKFVNARRFSQDGGGYGGFSRPGERTARREGGRDETKQARWFSSELRFQLTIIYLVLSGAFIASGMMFPRYAFRAGVCVIIIGIVWLAVRWVFRGTRWPGGWATGFVAVVGWGFAEGVASGVLPPLWVWWLVAWGVCGAMFVFALPAILAALEGPESRPGD